MRSGEDPHNLGEHRPHLTSLTPEFDATRTRRKRMSLSDGFVRAVPHYVVNALIEMVLQLHERKSKDDPEILRRSFSRQVYTETPDIYWIWMEQPISAEP